MRIVVLTSLLYSYFDLQGSRLKSTAISHSSTHSSPYAPGRSLQSQDEHLLLEPAVSTITGSRGFSYVAPSIWDKLRLKIRKSSSFASFKRNLKTHYLSHAFS